MIHKWLINVIRCIFAGNLRRQLIVAVALVHATMMALFVWDLTERQRDNLLERQTDQAMSLSRSIATSAAGWVAARDLYGLQEIITAQSRYPELRFAIIADREGKILAHSDSKYLGQYLGDISGINKDKILHRSSELVDAVSPVMLAGNAVGWVRIGLGQQILTERLARISHDGIIYTLVAILIGSFIAWVMGTRLTRRLQDIKVAADSVQQGDIYHRANVSGTDEVSHVAIAFNKMLDSMIASRRQLEQSEERFDYAMLASNDGLWDWDLTTDHVYYSPRWKEMLGYSEDELDNSFDTWSRLVDSDGRSKTISQVKKCIAGDSSSFDVEFSMKHKNGSKIHVLCRGVLIRDEDGKPIRMVGIHSDFTDKKEKEKIIWEQANYDSLTLLPNRKLFQDLLDQEIKKTLRKGDQLWILFLDLDGFKEINDVLGHHKGDALLIMVAERIRENLRDSDIVARLGGDEFVVILSGVPDSGYVDDIAAKLVSKIAESYELLSDEVYISTSIGIANFPNDAENASDLLKFADQSMYVAKSEGKNCYSYFTPELQQASIIRSQLSKDLRQALSKQEFQMFYQPIVELGSGKVFKGEALIRWDHTEKGLISPAAFIPVAEETGVINDIGSWVFDNVFKQLEQWHKHYDGNFQVSINMSPYQLKAHIEKYDDWISRLADYNISGDSIVIEITEGLLLKSEKVVNDRLLEYRDAGVQVAIDDFGTGYSSLSYLKEFDIDYLKIDQSFTRNLEAGSSEHSLSEAIVVMAHKLGLKVIAEGIETEEQRKLLLEMGCDYGQGYLFSKPLPVADYEQKYMA